MSLFEVKPYDREVYEKELKDFLPQKILDVHTTSRPCRRRCFRAWSPR